MSVTNPSQTRRPRQSPLNNRESWLERLLRLARRVVQLVREDRTPPLQDIDLESTPRTGQRIRYRGPETFDLSATPPGLLRPTRVVTYLVTPGPEGPSEAQRAVSPRLASMDYVQGHQGANGQYIHGPPVQASEAPVLPAGGRKLTTYRGPNGDMGGVYVFGETTGGPRLSARDHEPVPVGEGTQIMRTARCGDGIERVVTTDTVTRGPDGDLRVTMQVTGSNEAVHLHQDGSTTRESGYGLGASEPQPGRGEPTTVYVGDGDAAPRFSVDSTRVTMDNASPHTTVQARNSTVVGHGVAVTHHTPTQAPAGPQLPGNTPTLNRGVA